ncbi:hypothetical protein BDN72DRAFT_833278 [Pluteus cervinus]|uniref:Uncharacterized protein n=1 Tax=Pluteus cervinus TaxID=181527 RepID=A0ACD3B8X2_9AGAR|nr:hypothetical protein BDN72DRAFT_833278 [Pluteus cervinus]
MSEKPRVPFVPQNYNREVLFQAPLSANPRSSAFSYSSYDPFDDTPPSNRSSRTSYPQSDEIPLAPNRRSAIPSSADPSPRGHRPKGLDLGGATSRYVALPYNDQYDLPTSSHADEALIKGSHNGSSSKPPKRHPFNQNFEPPNWWYIGLHIAMCLVAYPIIILFILVAKDKSLFWTRFIVSLGCGILGLMLGFSLLRFGKTFLEASTWATIIHQSCTPDAPGMRLKDLAAASEDGYSAYAGVKLLWDRFMYPGTAKKYRRAYDNRPWSLFIILFLILIGLAGALPFIFGRLIDIDAMIANQREQYFETIIQADLSDTDIDMANALAPAFDRFDLTWTLAPFSTHGGLPPAVNFPYNDDMVFFSETILSQLMPNGSGFGTFNTSTTAASIELQQNTTNRNILDVTMNDPGMLIRYPRWGVRIHCAKVTDPNLIIPRTVNTFTYMFLTSDLLKGLFEHFSMDYPADSLKFNASTVMQLNDTLPTNLNPADLAYGAFFFDNGVAHSLKSFPLSMGQDGNGWVTLESVIVRLNTSYTPNGTFLRLSDLSVPDATGNASFIGYDAAVCLELFEPWVLETYNTSMGLPTTLRLLDKSATILNHDSQQLKESNIGATITDPDVKRQLNSTGLVGAYIAAHQNSVNQILKDNGRDAFYVPSPTIVSFTGGQGPVGYTELSPDFFGQARALADASNMLPYFAGSGLTVARVYPDKIIATAAVRNIEMIAVLVFVLLLGVMAGLFVPKLPLSVPRRGFEVFSWMAAFQADELLGERPDAGLARNMELNDIQERVGELRFRYVAPPG